MLELAHAVLHHSAPNYLGIGGPAEGPEELRIRGFGQQVPDVEDPRPQQFPTGSVDVRVDRAGETVTLHATLGEAPTS